MRLNNRRRRLSHGKLLEWTAKIGIMLILSWFMVWQIVMAVDREARLDEQKRLAAEREMMRLEVVREHNRAVQERIAEDIKRMERGEY